MGWRAPAGTGETADSSPGRQTTGANQPHSIGLKTQSLLVVRQNRPLAHKPFPLDGCPMFAPAYIG